MTRLHCSIGIGDTLVRAKIATEFGKPRGVYRLTRHNWIDVMGDRPTTALWGVGNRVAARLAGLGIRTVRELAESPDEPLIAEFGPNTGPHIGRLGRGREQRHSRRHPVGRTRPRPRDDVPAQPQHGRGDRRGAAHAGGPGGEDLRREGRAAARVHLKVRFAPFFTVTRVRKLPEPTYDAVVITQTALELLHKLADDRPIRLLGVRAEMVPPEGGYDPPRTHGRRGGP